MKKNYAFLTVTLLLFGTVTLYAEETSVDNDVITTAEGVVKTYVKNSNTMNYSGLGQFLGGVSCELVFNEETHTVYWKNPQTSLRSNTYIAGTYTDTSLSFSMPQTIQNRNDNIVVGHRMVKNETGSGDSYIIDDSKPITFTIAEDGVITMDGTGEDVIFSYTQNDKWSKFANYEVVMTPFDTTVMTIDNAPAEIAAKFEDWSLFSSSNRLNVKLAEYDGNLYLAGLDPDNTNSFIVGKMEREEDEYTDDYIVTFPSGQYSGIDGYLYQYKMFGGLDSDGNLTDKAVFIYSPEYGVIDRLDGSFCFYGGDIVNNTNIEMFEKYGYMFIMKAPSDMSLQPKAPCELSIYPHESDGYTNFYFEADKQNVDSWPLDEHKLYYRIYFDNKIYTFTPDDYSSLEGDTTDINYLFSLKSESDSSTEIGPYGTNGNTGLYCIRFPFVAENPGVQSVYKDNDKEYCSEIVYCTPISDVKDAFVEKAVVCTTYTDLTGITVATPAAGLYVKTVTYSDGSRTTEKVFVR
jgi:hypothetical protein